VRWAALLALVLLLGCKQREQAAAPPTSSLTAVEVQRGVDACAAYQSRVCATAKQQPERAELAQACALAPAASDAMKTALDIARHPESARRDVLQAQDAFRKTLAHCIERAAALPTP
jgi:hypothetical protein